MKTDGIEQINSDINTSENIISTNIPANEEINPQPKDRDSEAETKAKLGKKKKILILLITLAILFLIGLFYLISDKPKESGDNGAVVKQTTEDKVGSSPFFKMNYSFAEYKLDNTPFNPSIPNYTLNHSELTNLSYFESSNQNIAFTDSQKTALNQNHFFVAKNLDKFYGDDPEKFSSREDDWTYLYGKIGGSSSIYYRKPENAVFVTSDFLLHVYHKLLEKEFEYIEQKEFYPRLKEMTDALFDQSLADYDEASDPSNKASYERLVAFFAVPKSILDSAHEEFLSPDIADKKLDTEESILGILDSFKSKMPKASYELAKEELALILGQDKLEKSPIFGDLLAEEDLSFVHDYTQYGPRSHYNKNSILRSYFKTMMWYGRSNFSLVSSELTRDAINISLLLSKTNQLKNWEDIYAPTAFFVGKSDDLGVYEYGEIIEDLGVSEVDDKVIIQAQEKLREYESPQIMSSAVAGDKVSDLTKEELQAKTKGFRFMGQRFTPDAFIFTTLTQGDEKPDPETGESLPSSTTALMVMSSLGSQTAKPLVDDWVSSNAPNSKNVLNNRLSALKQQFNTVPEDVWTQNIYWGWLYTIKSLFNDSLDKTGYPGFMKNESWNKKDLQTALGSWTELKHDTLLYAKQSYAELGAGGSEEEIPPVPKGYVEPNVIFLDRLIALTRMTNTGLAERNLLDNVFQGRNEKLAKSLEFFRTIAVKEIQNEVISDDDYEKLRLEAGRLGYILMPLPNEEQTENGARSALIADVHTDTLKGEIMYEATGIPNYIYVAIKDANGIRLTKGLVFSYFEFNNPLGERLTDEKWREFNYTQDKSKLPSAPAWSSSFIR